MSEIQADIMVRSAHQIVEDVLAFRTALEAPQSELSAMHTHALARPRHEREARSVHSEPRDVADESGWPVPAVSILYGTYLK